MNINDRKIILSNVNAVNAFAKNGVLNKYASDGMLDAIKTEIGNKVSGMTLPEASKLVSPTLLTVALSASGFGIAGSVVGLAARVFGFSFLDFFGKMSSFLSDKESVSPSEVDSEVHSAVDSGMKNVSDQEAEEKMRNLKKADFSEKDLIKLAKYSRLVKTASLRDTASEFLKKLLSFIIQAFLTIGGWIKSAATYVKDKVVNLFSEPEPEVAHSTQTKFKAAPGFDGRTFNINSSWTYNGNSSNIKDIVLMIVNEVYPDTKPLANIIESTVGFNSVVDEITNYNQNHQMNVVFMPKMYKNKKMIADLIIDEVAEKSQ